MNLMDLGSGEEFVLCRAGIKGGVSIMILLLVLIEVVLHSRSLVVVYLVL